MHPLLNRNWTYTEETVEQCRARYTGFGHDVYNLMLVQTPDDFHALRFYQANVYQPEDSYAVCELDHPFVIQLDPDCKVICLWDGNTHIEIGTWSDDPCQAAIDFIRNHFKNKAEQAVPSDGHKPSNSDPSSDTTAPADAL